MGTGAATPRARKGPGRPPLNGEDRCRDLLLRAGKACFARHGYEGTTVRDIAGLAGVNLSMVSYYFEGKEGLYRACLEEFGKARLKDVGPLLEKPASAEEFRVRIRLLVQHLMRSYADEPELTKIVAREVENGLPIAKEIFEATYLKMTQAIVSFVKEAQTAGYVRRELVTHCCALATHAIANFLFRAEPVSRKYFDVSMRDEATRAAYGDTIARLLLDGLMVDAGGKQPGGKRR